MIVATSYVGMIHKIEFCLNSKVKDDDMMAAFNYTLFT